MDYVVDLALKQSIYKGLKIKVFKKHIKVKR